MNKSRTHNLYSNRVTAFLKQRILYMISYIDWKKENGNLLFYNGIIEVYFIFLKQHFFKDFAYTLQ